MNKNLIRIIESLNDRYKIGEIESIKTDNCSDLIIEIRICDILFSFTALRHFCKEVEDLVISGEYTQSIKNVQSFLLNCLNGINIGYTFADLYQPYSPVENIYEIIDKMNKLENTLKDITEKIRLELTVYDKNENLAQELKNNI